MQIIFSDHAIFEMKRRQIDRKEVENLIRYPEQTIAGKKNRTIVQGMYHLFQRIYLDLEGYSLYA